jgi:hypothetical protein
MIIMQTKPLTFYGFRSPQGLPAMGAILLGYVENFNDNVRFLR